MNVSSLTQKWARDNKFSFKFYPSIGSTNTECKNSAFATTEPFFLCFADHQTGGRGRFDRKWMDHGAGSYLLSSWSYQVDQLVHPLVSARIGLQVANALSKVFFIKNLSLKVPNDIYLGKKKVAGLLTETVSQGDRHRLIIGLGLNVLAAPDEQAEATCLKDENAALNEGSWNSFLNFLSMEFSKIATSSHKENLDTNEQEELLKHLNAFPLLKEKYLAISKDGSLETSKEKISWMDI